MHDLIGDIRYGLRVLRKRPGFTAVALGASRRHVLWLVVRGGMTPALVGIGLGLVGAFAFTRVMSGLLFSVTPSDPATYAGVVLALATAALVACLLPGLSALRVDPATSLRDE